MKSTFRRALGLSLLTVAGLGPVIYPLWLLARTRRLPDPIPPEPEEWPDVTVVVPAYRESTVIGTKVENTLANGYPGTLEVLVVTEDEMTEAAARRTRATVIGSSSRLGKAEAMNLGVSAAGSPVVVFTDANAMMTDGGIERLVRWLTDPANGAVAGEKRVVGPGGDSLYWSFESWLKRHESRTGSTIGVVGEALALRREDYVDVPADVAVDDLWVALDVVEQGKRVVYEPEAVVQEEPHSLHQEWERRTRVVAGTLDVLWRRRRLLAPGSSPVADQLWGHRLVRSSLGPVAHALLLLLALRSARRSALACLFLGAHVYGGAALARRRRGAPTSRLGSAAAQVLFLQAVGVAGTLRWARGDRPALWPKPERVVPGAGRAAAGPSRGLRQVS